MDRTPKFNAQIDKILKDLIPHNKVCSMCQKEFYIDEKDIEFINKFKIPVPQKCEECRRQIRLSFANYTTLFKRKCDAPNHNEKIISSIPEGTSFPVYDFDEYWFGDRDRYENAQDVDFNKLFLTQFNNLFFVSPEPALTRNPTSINSEYSSYGVGLNNCYYTFGGLNSENSMFGVWPMNTKNSLDFLINTNTDLCYESVYPNNCFNCNFVYFSDNCLDSSFIYDCRNCSNCFGCVNLRNKKYCIWNKEYSKEEYSEKIKEFNLGKLDNIKEFKNIFWSLIKSLPIRATRNEHSDKYSGNYIINSKNSFNSMWVLNCDNVKNMDFSLSVRDSFDITISYTSERVYYNSCTGVNCSNVYFSVFGRELRDSEYVMNCKNCQYCFLCVGLENAKYCILNKQYNEEEYWRLVDDIKVKMLENGEYGEFFPLSISPFPYNASLSNIIYPTSKEKVLELGGWWYNEDNNVPEGFKILRRNELSLDVKDLYDGILNVGIVSGGNGKLFRITKDELDFYKRKNIAIPEFTPYERIVSRFNIANNFKVFKDKCFKCNKEILSSYATSEGYKPYCDDCYKKEIY